MTEIDLNSYLEQGIARRFEIEGELRHIHGEHASRIQTISHVLKQEGKEQTKEGDQEKTVITSRRMKRDRPEPVHTFPKDEEGNLLVPLGGKRGYIYGALRVAMLDLYKDKLKSRKWKGYGIRTFIEQALFIEPEWITVGKEFTNSPKNPKKYMVQTKGISKSMMNTYYDWVEGPIPFKIAVETTNESIPDDILLSMLAHIQRLGLGPKGRGRIKILKVMKTK